MSRVTTSRLIGHELKLYEMSMAMTDGEKAVIVKTIPTQILELELARRDAHCGQIYADVCDLLQGTSVDTLDELEALIKALRVAIKG